MILELKPKNAASLLPGLPSYILFMCIRHTDYTNDDAKLKSLLSGTVNGIKRVVKVTYRLLYYFQPKTKCIYMGILRF